MSELGPRARALIDATRSADDPTPAETDRVRGTIEARIALGAGTVMASAAVVTTTGSAAAAPTAAAVVTAAWVKVAAGVVVACAVAGGAGVVAMSSSNGAGATRAGLAASPASPPSPVPSVRVAVSPARGPSMSPVPVAPPQDAPSAPIVLPVASAAPAPGAMALRPRPAVGPSSLTAPAPATPVAPAPAAPAPIALDSALDHEIALLSVARSSLREGNPSAALTVLHDAAQRFPNGPLAEDRAAETVFALCALGRSSEARTEAARLLADHPRSPHAAAVRESCGGPIGSPNP